MFGTFLIAMFVSTWVTVSCQLPECTTPRCSCCKDQVCSSSNDTCINGCFDGIWGNSCDLPCPINCTICTQHGTTCTSCIAGKYGSDCSNECPANCATCTHDNNEDGYPCTSCKTGFTGAKCNECTEGYYRERDAICVKCSNFCKNGTCDALSGYCLNGCLDKYWGVACLNRCPKQGCLICRRETGTCEACDNGKYNTFCSADCNAECASNAQAKKLCKIENGQCFIGCRTKTIYGPFCQKLCSKHCVDSECDRVTGNCNECEGDKYGSSCQYDCGVNCLQQGESQRRCYASNGSCVHDCVSGYYGYECQYKCSSRCNTPGCSRTYGRCDDGCRKGYMQWGSDCEKDPYDYDDDDDNGSSGVAEVLGSFGGSAALDPYDYDDDDDVNTGADLSIIIGPIAGISALGLTYALVFVIHKWLVKRRKRDNDRSGDDTSNTSGDQPNNTNHRTAATGNTSCDQSNHTNYSTAATDLSDDNTSTNQTQPPAYVELNEILEQVIRDKTSTDQPPPAYEELTELPEHRHEYDELATGVTGSDDFDNLDRLQKDTGQYDTIDQRNKTKHTKSVSFV